jgi:hypothetical protein
MYSNLGNIEIGAAQMFRENLLSKLMMHHTTRQNEFLG